ncbi:MAG: lipopolysaccharide kinase InaA family protein [Gemmatimonadota bacterium]
MTVAGDLKTVRTPEAWGFAVPQATPWLDATLTAGRTLHGWAAAQEGVRALQGRGKVYSVPAPVHGPDGRERWVVRHYLRGGAVARYLHDRYLAVGRPRPLVEAQAVTGARERGVSTPAVVAGAVYPAGLFYRADLVTEEIPGASDLAQILFGDNPLALDPEGALVATGRFVRSLERAGILHPDLNAKNLVLRPSDAPAGEGGEARERLPAVHLVDLDRCCARDQGVPVPVFAMRRRLERSLRKFENRRRRHLSPTLWSALRRGFGEAP